MLLAATTFVRRHDGFSQQTWMQRTERDKKEEEQQQCGIEQRISLPHSTHIILLLTYIYYSSIIRLSSHQNVLYINLLLGLYPPLYIRLYVIISKSQSKLKQCKILLDSANVTKQQEQPTTSKQSSTNIGSIEEQNNYE